MTFRRTKIVATLGPSSSSPERLEQLILAGLDVARLNFSHGSADEHRARARLVRELAAKHGRFVALLGDLQGPKIRIAKFIDKRIELAVGDRFRFSVTHPREAGTQEVVGIDYPDLVKDCSVGDELPEATYEDRQGRPKRVRYWAMQELAGQFHSFYNKNRVITEDRELSEARLFLLKCVAQTLKNALAILGVSAPEKM